MTTDIAVLWDMTPCGSLNVTFLSHDPDAYSIRAGELFMEITFVRELRGSRRFRSLSTLQRVTSPKTAMSMVTVLRTSNFTIHLAVQDTLELARKNTLIKGTYKE